MIKRPARFPRSMLPALLVACWCRADVLIGDFEGANPLANWSFWNGAEFPGATGSLTLGNGRGAGGHGAHLAFDMSNGGNYVSADYRPAQVIRAEAALSFWTRAPAGVNINCRIIDSTNQTLQYNLARPLGAIDSSQWFHLTVDFRATPGGHWGGANDGALHGGVKGVSILAEPFCLSSTAPQDSYFVRTGAIDFDDVWLTDSLVERIDPSAAPTALPGAGDLAAKLGANIHFTNDDRALDALASAGFTWVRMDLAWAGVERTKGIYDFSAYDTLVAALGKRGMKAHLILDYSNTLYAGVTAWNVGPVTADAIAGFAAFARAAAAHFVNKADHFEIWNEPNLAGFWAPAADAAAYGALAHDAVAAVHAGNPSAQVSTGGLSGMDQGFLQASLGAGAGTGADAVGVHPYRQGSPETVAGDLLMMQEIVRRQFPVNTPPLWQTEWGYSSTWYGSGTAAAPRREQAKLVVREILTSWILGFPFMVYYDVRDDGTDPTNGEHNFGLLANDYQDKPAMTALRVLAAHAQGRTLQGVYPVNSHSFHAIKLGRAADVTLILWVDKGRAWDESGSVDSVRVWLAQSPASVVDMLGAALPLPAARNGQWPLVIGDEVTYVTFSATAGSPRVPRTAANHGAARARKLIGGSSMAGTAGPAGIGTLYNLDGSLVIGRGESGWKAPARIYAGEPRN